MLLFRAPHPSLHPQMVHECLRKAVSHRILCWREIRGPSLREVSCIPPGFCFRGTFVCGLLSGWKNSAGCPPQGILLLFVVKVYWWDRFWCDLVAWERVTRKSSIPACWVDSISTHTPDYDGCMTVRQGVLFHSLWNHLQCSGPCSIVSLICLPFHRTEKKLSYLPQSDSERPRSPSAWPILATPFTGMCLPLAWCKG